MLQDELKYAIDSDTINPIFSFNKLYEYITLVSTDWVVYGIKFGNEPVPFLTIFATMEIDADIDAASLSVPSKPEPVIYWDALVTFIANSLLDITSGISIKSLLITLSVTNPV